MNPLSTWPVHKCNIFSMLNDPFFIDQADLHIHIRYFHRGYLDPKLYRGVHWIMLHRAIQPDLKYPVSIITEEGGDVATNCIGSPARLIHLAYLLVLVSVFISLPTATLI